MCAVLNLRLEAESYFTFRLSFKIVAQYFGSASQLSCVPNSSSESQYFVACYFLSSPFVASQSYEARPTLSGSDTCGARANYSKSHLQIARKNEFRPPNSEFLCYCLWLAAHFPELAPAPRGFQESEHMRNHQIGITQMFHINRLQHNLII